MSTSSSFPDLVLALHGTRSAAGQLPDVHVNGELTIGENIGCLLYTSRCV